MTSNATTTVITDDRTFEELGAEEKLAVLTLRVLESGVTPAKIRVIVERTISFHQDVDAELAKKSYGHLKVMK